MLVASAKAAVHETGCLLSMVHMARYRFPVTSAGSALLTC